MQAVGGARRKRSEAGNEVRTSLRLLEAIGCYALPPVVQLHGVLMKSQPSYFKSGVELGALLGCPETFDRCNCVPAQS